MNDFFSKAQNMFSQQHIHNGKTQNNINLIHQLLISNQNFDQLIEQLKHWQDDPNLTIQNHTFWLFISIGILLLLPTFLIHPIFCIAACSCIVFAFYKRTSTKSLNRLIDFAKQKCLEAKYQIYFNNIDEANQNIESPYNFPFFDLGNHENLIRHCIYGQWQVNEVNYPYMLFNYHYVDKEETRNSEGKKEVEYHHYDLWGIVLENFPTQGVSISSKQKRASRLGVKWSSGDIRFDNQYQLSGIDEMRLAKFFTPNHVLMLEKAMAYFKGDFYIQAHRSSLCWLFKIDILKQHTQVNKVQTVQDLASQLETLKLPDYEVLKQSILTILEEIQTHYQLSAYDKANK